ncbi:MAG: multiple sugar transport system permease protein [Bradyrhizobium sp.]|jgi:multiple sugar transport system permease protein|nr:multiple sugar transport system permease protein [Bradyrhizobium sp.]
MMMGRVVRRWRSWLALMALCALTLAFVFPILWMAFSSFQAGDKMFDLTAGWIPREWHLENYPSALARANFPLYFLNSAVIAIVVTASNALFCVLAGYGLAKFRFPGDRYVLLIILSTLMLPIEVTLVPTFLIVHQFDWINTYEGIAAPFLVDAFGIFLIRQSMISIPIDYIEAARMDGAGELRILWRIIVPQCWPAIAVLTIFSFRESWDQFIWPLTVVSNDEMRTYPLGLVIFNEDYGTPPTEQMAIAVLATIPIFVIFLLLQRAINKGFGLSGLK